MLFLDIWLYGWQKHLQFGINKSARPNRTSIMNGLVTKSFEIKKFLIELVTKSSDINAFSC